MSKQAIGTVLPSWMLFQSHKREAASFAYLKRT